VLSGRDAVRTILRCDNLGLFSHIKGQKQKQDQEKLGLVFV